MTNCVVQVSVDGKESYSQSPSDQLGQSEHVRAGTSQLTERSVTGRLAPIRCRLDIAEVLV